MSAVRRQGARDLHLADAAQVADRPVELLERVVGCLAIAVRLVLLDSCDLWRVFTRHFASRVRSMGACPIPTRYPSGPRGNEIGEHRFVPAGPGTRAE
jgi:hypothetical protein